MGCIRQPAESDVDFAKRRAFETGHLWGPENVDGPNVKPGDLATLRPDDGEMRQAFIGLSKMMVRDYAYEFALQYGTTPAFDGKLDRALLKVMETPRCDVPDYAPPPGAHFQFLDPHVQEVAVEMQRLAVAPAIGKRGNWPRCHGATDSHCAMVMVNMANRPTWATDAIMQQVWKNVQTAYAAIGQWIIYVDKNMTDLLTGKSWSGHHVDTVASWAKSSSGWIGLAILTLDLGCASEIWQQYLATYTGGSSADAIVTQQSSLWRHEHGHNSGLQHTNGGTMNPSIVNGLPVMWTPQDPSTSSLKLNYGGEPAGPPGGGGGGGGSPPTGTVEQRLAAVEVANQMLRDQLFENTVRDTVQDVKFQVINDRLKNAGIP